MTIASEITRIKDNIAAAYTAAGNKGATMPVTQNSANLATTVESIPAGGGDTVTAINYTGAAIAQGDKVWLKKKANVSASAVAINFSSNAVPIIDPTGTAVYLSSRKYDIASGTLSSTSVTFSSNAGEDAYYYDSNNNIYCGQKYINASTIQDIGLICNQDDYAIDPSGSGTSFTLYKVDKSNNFAVTQTWTVNNCSQSATVSSRRFCIIGNKIYCNRTSTDGRADVGTINPESATITLSGYISTDIILHSTADNKIAIAAQYLYSTQTDGWAKIKLFNVNNDYTLGNEFVSGNSDLSNMLTTLTRFYFTFNRVTGILCISSSSSYYGSNYGVFKYENGDFTTISITLNDTSGGTSGQYRLLSTTTDLSMFQYAKILYTMEQTADNTYKAIPYNYAMGQDVLTGVADEAAVNGASFDATTILPEG